MKFNFLIFVLIQITEGRNLESHNGNSDLTHPSFPAPAPIKEKLDLDSKIGKNTVQEDNEDSRILELNFSSVASLGSLFPFGLAGLGTVALITLVPLLLLLLYGTLIFMYPDPYSDVKIERDIATAVLYMGALGNEIESKVFDFLEALTDPKDKETHFKPIESAYHYQNDHPGTTSSYESYDHSNQGHNSNQIVDPSINQLEWTHQPHREAHEIYPTDDYNHYESNPTGSHSSFQHSIPIYENNNRGVQEFYPQSSNYYHPDPVPTHIHPTYHPHHPRPMDENSNISDLQPSSSNTLEHFHSLQETPERKETEDQQKQNVYTEVANIYVTQMGWKENQQNNRKGTPFTSEYSHAFSSKDQILTRPFDHLKLEVTDLHNTNQEPNDWKRLQNSYPLRNPSFLDEQYGRLDGQEDQVQHTTNKPFVQSSNRLKYKSKLLNSLL